MMQLCSEAKKSPSSMDATQLLDSSLAVAWRTSRNATMWGPVDEIAKLVR